MEHHVPPRGPASPRQRLGHEGETRAAEFLQQQGYRIVARNVRADRVEIDLVARRGPLIIFIEVKTRRSDRFGSAAEAVDQRKQHRLRRGAQAWLARRPEEARGWRRLRFDVVTCKPPGPSNRPKKTTAPENPARWQIEHWQAAF